MDWKRLIQFALRGSGDLEPYAILVVRVSIGLFFAISGANKLFIAGGTKPVYDTLVKAGAPFPHQLAYFVASVEFVCGSLVAVGFLSTPASVALLIDMTRHRDQRDFHVTERTFAAELARRFPLPSGSAVRALLYLADLRWSGKVQYRLLARRQDRDYYFITGYPPLPPLKTRELANISP
jgi:hypothetical protein